MIMLDVIICNLKAFCSLPSCDHDEITLQEFPVFQSSFTELQRQPCLVTVNRIFQRIDIFLFKQKDFVQLLSKCLSLNMLD